MPLPSFPWVANVMVHQLGTHIHSKEIECLDNNNSNVNVLPIKSSRKRPAMLVLPEFSPEKVFYSEKRKIENVEVAFQGREYCVLSKKGRRENMEDRYKVITDIAGDSNQAFFAVVDGHGGQAAADYVADNLGKNILSALENLVEADQHTVDQAIRGGYLETDKGFLSQGGFVHRCNGVWRLQGTLAVSRAIGDLHLKEWIISEPEIQKVPLTSECDFLIMASDGLWDKVSEQEAVDVVSREEVNTMESCKKLVDISSSRGNKDDITVLVINLQTFVAAPVSSAC
ncbi:hypothetical protein SOVF_115970 [Spinacia oleracea]|nr:hypothetical protein SOVF_115970 [Spinacia oleracea]